MKLLAAAILLFIIGFDKCLAKARAFKRASIYSLASLGAATKKINDGNMCNTLEEYVNRARDIVIRQQPEDHHHHHQVVEEEDPGELAIYVPFMHLRIIFYHQLACSLVS